MELSLGVEDRAVGRGVGMRMCRLWWTLDEMVWRCVEVDWI